MTRSTRRGLLGGAAVLAVPTLPTAAAPAVSPDARLLEACAAYMANEAERNAAWNLECDAVEAGDKPTSRHWDEVQRRLGPPQIALLQEIIDTRATTPEGREAKALVAMDLVQTDREGNALDHDQAMLWSLAEDMAGRELEAPA